MVFDAFHVVCAVPWRLCHVCKERFGEYQGEKCRGQVTEESVNTAIQTHRTNMNIMSSVFKQQTEQLTNNIKHSIIEKNKGRTKGGISHGGQRTERLA